MFNKLFSRNICKFESNTSDCNLVQQLKDKQDLKKKIDKEIKSIESCKNSSANLDNLYELFYNFSYYGYFHFKYRYSREYKNSLLDFEEKLLNYISKCNIDSIVKELDAVKQKATILNEKRIISKQLEEDILNIKKQLGIE